MENYNDKIKELLNKDLIINSKKYKSFNYLKNLLNIELDKICNNYNYFQIIHGDLFFGNMFYDVNSNILKVIDPRGSYGDIRSIYGDIRYDIAKLNHSINGKYDFIVNRLYAFELQNFDNNEFSYIIYDNDQHRIINELFNDKLKNYNFNLKEINIITACLFLSMIPLHKENFNNQKALLYG